MGEQAVMVEKVWRYVDRVGTDEERFDGLANFTEWRLRYPADVEFRVRRMTVRDDLVVGEVSVSYDGGPWQFGVQLLEFRGDKVARERIYGMPPWDAAEWPAPWRSATSAG